METRERARLLGGGPPAEDASSRRDGERFRALVEAGHPCVAVVTQEEAHALDLVRAAAMDTGRNLLLWSATRGVHGGLFEGAGVVEKTEHPAAALFHFAQRVPAPALCVTLDLVGHLGEPRTLRALRDAVEAFRSSRRCLVLIDHRDDLPAVVAAETMPLEISLPDDDALERIVRTTLRRLHKESPVEARLARRDLETIVRNLHGLTRNQAEQIVVECVGEDRRFDAQDTNTRTARCGGRSSASTSRSAGAAPRISTWSAWPGSPRVTAAPKSSRPWSPPCTRRSPSPPSSTRRGSWRPSPPRRPSRSRCPSAWRPFAPGPGAAASRRDEKGTVPISHPTCTTRCRARPRVRCSQR